MVAVEDGQLVIRITTSAPLDTWRNLLEATPSLIKEIGGGTDRETMYYLMELYLAILPTEGQLKI